jgi:hypothetical protein
VTSHKSDWAPFASRNSYPLLNLFSVITRLRPQQIIPPLARPWSLSPGDHHPILPFHPSRPANQLTRDTRPWLLRLTRRRIIRAAKWLYNDRNLLLGSSPRISRLNTLLAVHRQTIQNGTLFLTSIRKMPLLSESRPPLTAKQWKSCPVRKQGARRPSPPTAASTPTMWAPCVQRTGLPKWTQTCKHAQQASTESRSKWPPPARKSVRLLNPFSFHRIHLQG